MQFGSKCSGGIAGGKAADGMADGMAEQTAQGMIARRWIVGTLSLIEIVRKGLNIAVHAASEKAEKSIGSAKRDENRKDRALRPLER